LHQYWPNIFAAICLIAIPIWVYWYYHTTLYAIGKPWMDPRLPAVNRLDMHVPLRLYTSLHAARQGACHVELVSRATLLMVPLPHGQDPTTNDTSPEMLSSPSLLLAPNVWNLDKLHWKFKLLPTVEKALTEVYEDNAFFQDDTMAQFDNYGNTANSNKDNSKKNSNEEYPWSDMAVPSNWMFRNGQVPFDKPIYTNQKYPFPCTPPIVPRNNPTGVYRTFISLPDEWLEMDDQEEVEFNNHSWSDSDDEGDGITSPYDEATTTITPSSKRSSYTLLLHGIESACFVYWNGELIGFCKDSRLPSEFVIPHHHLVVGVGGASQHHHPTSHVLHLVVVRWSDGSYVEDQDHWWMAGVHRSVELIRRPAQADIVDFQVLRATAEGQLHVRVVTRNRGRVVRRSRGMKQASSSPPSSQQQQRSITVRLFQDDQQLPDNTLGNIAKRSSSGCWKPAPSEIWSATLTIPDQPDNHVDVPHKKKTGPVMNTTTLHFETTIENPKLWTAETPSLYTLVIEQQDQKQQQISKTTQVESCRIGFRSVEITKQGILQVNGKRITICGINRHEHDPDQGKVVSLDRMKQDIVTLK
jgi:beta-galactosidase